jgi:hypothetical protein
MLDDFKTELRRLGMKRIRKDELRRQSHALVLDDKDDDEEVEFADALGPSPANRRPTLLSSGNSPDGRLREASLLEDRGRPRANAGSGGVKISKLPGLKNLGFGFGKSKKDDEEGVIRNDLEKQESREPRKPANSSSDDANSRDDEHDQQMGGGLGSLDFHTKPAGI